MKVYYNENDPKAAAWLKQLIHDGVIPAGDVDQRSILDVGWKDLSAYTQCHFFAGIGGWAYALSLAGWPADRVVWTGSCPCQPFSDAGKGLAESDERHLWPYFRNLIGHRLPATIFGEQVASKLGREWLHGVRADLERARYAVGAADLCAAGVGAPHIRQRLFWVAKSQSEGRTGMESEREAGQRVGSRIWSGGTNGGLGFSDSAGREQGRQAAAPARYGSATESAGNLGGMGESMRKGRSGKPFGLLGASNQRNRPPAEEGGDPGRVGEESNGPVAETSAVGCGMGHPAIIRSEVRTPLHRELRREGLSEGCEPSHWGKFNIIPCRDGKSRRIESGTFPLVNGLPRGVVPVGDPSVQEAQASGESRIVRLRGYGNAIVPQESAKFIQASIEALT